MTVLGIDVARYQPDDYPTGGLDFVFVKATEGVSYMSPAHDAQVARGRAAGLVVGHYHFQRPGSPTAQAAYFLKHARPRPGDMLACDWEDTGVSNKDKDVFMRAVKAARPDLREVLYCNRDFWLHRDTTSYCADGLWIADPSAPKGHPRVEHPWVFHQYAIAGGTDRNIGNFPDRAALAAWAAGTPTPDIQEDDTMAISSDDARTIGRQVVTGANGMHAPGDPGTEWSVSAYLGAIYAQGAAQAAAITALAGLVGTGVDTDTVVTAVRQAIADAVVQVHVDITGTDPAQP
jgi:hypothetical protein